MLNIYVYAERLALADMYVRKLISVSEVPLEHVVESANQSRFDIEGVCSIKIVTDPDRFRGYDGGVFIVVGNVGGTILDRFEAAAKAQRMEVKHERAPLAPTLRLTAMTTSGK